MNAIEIIRRACRRLGIPVPNAAVSNEDTQIAQLLELLNEEGQELSAEYDWQALTFEASFTTFATESQGTVTSIIGAANNYRHIISDTLFNRDSLMPIYGPKAKQAWQAQKALNLTGPWPQYRIRGGEIIMDPVPTAGEDVYFEYLTRNWVTSSNGMEARYEVEDDEDEFRLDPEILLLGLQWRWQAAKGLDYTDKFQSYTRRVQDAKGRDGTSRKVNMACEAERYPAGYVTPIGNWTL